MKANLYKIAIAISVGTIVFTAISGCERKGSDPKGTTSSSAVVIRVGYRPKAIADVTPVVIKESNLSDPSIKVELVPVSSPTDALQKLAAGEVEAIAGLPMEPIFQQMTTSDIGLMAYGFQVDEPGNGWASLVGSKKNGIRTIKDLAGKTVASLPTSQAQYFMRKILKASGIPDSQIKIVTYNPQTPLIGLRSGEHNAILGLDPAISLAISEDNPVLMKAPISTLLYGGKPFPLTASLYSRKFAAAHPEAFAKFIEAVGKAIEFTKTHSTDVRGYLTKEQYGGFDPKLTQLFSLPKMVMPNSEMHDITAQFVKDLVRDGQLKKPVNIEMLFGKTGG